MSLPVSPSRLHSAFQGLRLRLRGSDLWFIALALVVGLLAGYLTLLQSGIARWLQGTLYGLDEGMRLSSLPSLTWTALLVLPLGGLLVGLVSLAATRLKRPLLDAVEANALHGGRMSMRDNLIVLTQTLLSNGCGASVGLEASYTQMGAGSGSQLGRVMRLRRNDVRILVGAGAAGAIAAAFGAPLAGAFYAFEIVIGAYTPAALAPVAVAALAGAFVADQAGIEAYLLPAASTIDVRAADYAIYGLLGCCCAMVGIVIMRLIASIEGTVKRSPLPLWGRPVVGGLLLIPLALASPQVLSSGHGALHLDLTTHLPLIWIGGLLTLKCLASGISLGFGFRGGLFFASLFMGTLVGALFAGLLAMATGVPVVDATSAALAGMAALAAAVVGAPMTMAMLVLEGTHDFLLTSVVMSAVLVSSTLVRQWFGYSFSTWRMHLRGETIKSARDVGWVQNLNAGRLMRKGVATAPADLDAAAFCQRFPLGSGSRVILIDSEGHYAGIVQIPRVYGDGVKPETTIGELAENRDVSLPPAADVVSVMQRFDQTQADELAVVAADGQVLGVVSEAFVRKRYAEELDKRQRELMGERVEDTD
ncbi:TPA: chloride channel protein [Stenotrophomonas maltophilia]|uniref:chloride channel protein n=1 Tax=Stenotrophomonas TaxID=40323 RepID=UPI00066BCEAB|nr:chloride channel protein [Stenotrophomonas maltophilia]MCI1139430.1 chloride channel protein [Stenotrophomonas maltophilia]MCO7474737.1 chloride channel protein [Stenotrophomonas maltophilia]MCO7479406.1 chloride channel protein [Stenotrophomonas maltophilia]UVH71370.1 chloride channel protein [Stenotrophomonas maltophilia]